MVEDDGGEVLPEEVRAMNGRRLTPKEIAEKFGAMRREHEARVKRSKERRARHEQAADTRAYLATQTVPTVGANIGNVLREKYREGMRLRNERGHFIGLPK